MKLKRLKHHADELAHQACGWQIFVDMKRIASLGEGTFRIDVLTGECVLEGATVTPLGIALVLKEWLERDASDYGIPISMYSEAVVDLRFKVRDPKRHDATAELHADSRVVAAGREYTSSFEGEQFCAIR